MSKGLCRFSAPLLLISDPCFGAFAQGIARGLSARHDHGSQYMSDAFQQELAFLGIESSPAFVRAPEGNGCAERFIRTLKENLLWVRTFDTVASMPGGLWVRSPWNAAPRMASLYFSTSLGT